MTRKIITEVEEAVERGISEADALPEAGFVVCMARDHTPMREGERDGQRSIGLVGKSIAVFFNYHNAAKVSRELNRKYKVGRFEVLPTAHWKPLRKATLKSLLASIAELEQA